MGADVGGGQVLYLYGVVPCGQRLPKTEAGPLEAVPFSSLAAVVEPVLSTEFSSEALEQKLQCVEWVAPLARKHTAVLEAAMEHGPVVPAPLCTLFSSADALTSLLARNEQRFQDALSWLKDRQEWGFKVMCDEAGLRSTLASSDPGAKTLEAAAARESPGQAYVLGKRRDRRLAEAVSARIDEVVEQVLDALTSLAVESRLRPLLSEAALGRSGVMVLNAALLVDFAVCRELQAEAAKLASRLSAEGFAFELTGPWPPYSFCGDDDATSGLGAHEPAPGDAS